jgi:beta-1,4-mannosyl-glycoprotein beta-1,4-N-acetylglucosaminyltransferase
MIYDCFTFYNELDLLDARLHEHTFVDRFIIVEATTTFQGQPKPLWYADNASRFKNFADRIDHFVVDFPMELHNRFARRRNQTWAREYHQRDQFALGLRNARSNDLVIVSDVDEIISAAKFDEALKVRPPGSLTIFEVVSHPFFVNRRSQSRSLPWLRAAPRMIEFGRFSTGQQLRMTKPMTSQRLAGTALSSWATWLYNWAICGIAAPSVFVVERAGWHFTSLGDWRAYRDKVSAFAHAEHKELDIFKREDAFLRHAIGSTMLVHDEELPAFLRKNKALFPFFREG